MAISDYEPEEAASIVLEYKLSHYLNANQIEQISNEMLEDKRTSQMMINSNQLSKRISPITSFHNLISILD